MATIKSASFPDLTIPLIWDPTPAKPKNPATLDYASPNATWLGDLTYS
jgi:hypothetical protein